MLYIPLPFHIPTPNYLVPNLHCPFLGLIGYTGGSFPGVTYQCGGSLINKWYYVTAAHCVESSGLKPKDVKILVAEHDYTTKNETFS